MMVRKCLGFLSLSPVVANVPSRYIPNSSHSCLVNCSDSYVMLLRGILADPFMQVSDFLTMEHKQLLTHTDSLPKNCNWILGSTNFKKLQDEHSRIQHHHHHHHHHHQQQQRYQHRQHKLLLPLSLLFSAPPLFVNDIISTSPWISTTSIRNSYPHLLDDLSRDWNSRRLVETVSLSDIKALSCSWVLYPVPNFFNDTIYIYIPCGYLT